MQQVADTTKTYTLEEYIRLDEIGPGKHEFYDGKLIVMPGESLLHNKICIQILILLKGLISKEFDIFIESVKVNIEGENKYVYPDITVVNNQAVTDKPHPDYIIYQPLLIAEILSDSTRKHDLTDKFILYQKISTLQYYIAVEPEKPLVLFYEKNQEGEWTAKTFTGMEEIIALTSLNARISLSDIYKK